MTEGHLRIVRILTRPNLGGPTLQAVALWHAHKELGVRTLLVVGRCRPGEVPVDLRAHGLPAVGADAIDTNTEGCVELADLDNGWPWCADLRVRRQLDELLRRHRPQIVHTHTSKAGWLGRRAARRAGVPVVAHTFHGHVLRDYFGPLRSRLLLEVERRLAAATDLRFAVSPSCADELAALGVLPRQQIEVVPPAVPMPPVIERAQARRQLGVDGAQWLVACIGRLVKVKAVDRFVAAVDRLPHCHGHVHGSGPLQQQLVAQARATGRVAVRGSDPDVRRWLPAYDAVVIPSLREGCPLVAIEAFAASVPVVGFDVPGVRDALGPWGGGILVPPAAGVAGLADALERLHQDGRLRAECVAAGRRGLDRFAPAQVAARLLAAYQRALAARGGYAPSAP